MSTGSTPQQKLIRSALLRTAGPRADARAVSDACVGLWQRVAAQLVPIVGEGGVEALYTRCLNLQRIACPDGEAAGRSLATATPFLAVRLNLERREAAEALEASVALLDAFNTLLSTLIGKALTDRLLNPVWADRRTDEPAQENNT